MPGGRGIRWALGLLTTTALLFGLTVPPAGAQDRAVGTEPVTAAHAVAAPAAEPEPEVDTGSAQPSSAPSHDATEPEADHSHHDHAEDHADAQSTPGPDDERTLPFVVDPPRPVPLETLTIRGAYVIVAAGSDDHATAPALVKADGRVFMLAGREVAGGGLGDVEPGSRVELDAVRYPAGSLTGLGIGDAGDLRVLSVRVLRPAAASTARTGTRGAFIAVVRWPGMTRSALSAETLASYQSIGPWSQAASAGAFEWAPTVVEMELPVQRVCGDLPAGRDPGLNKEWRDAVVARATELGFDVVHDYRALAILLPQGVSTAAPKCVPTAYAYMGDGWGNEVWWLGLSVYSYAYSTKAVLVHELGHSLGLPHAESAPCAEGGAAVSLTYDGTCEHIEYGDVYDPMGQSFSSTKYNPVFSDHLGWLPAANRVDLTPFSAGSASGSREVTLTAYGETGTGIRAITTELPDPASGDLAGQIPGTLFVDYRRATGFESDWTYAEPDDKVYLRWKPSDGAAALLDLQQPDSYLIDTTPLTESAYDAGLNLAGTWTDPTGRLMVRFASRAADLSTATVTVSWAAPDGVPLPRSVSASSPDSGTVAVTWAAPEDTTDLAGFRVALSSGLGDGELDQRSCEVALGETLSCDFAGLRHNTAYSASVVSIGSDGSESLARTASATTPKLPLEAMKGRVVAADTESFAFRIGWGAYAPNNLPEHAYAYCRDVMSGRWALNSTYEFGATAPYDLVLRGFSGLNGRRATCEVSAFVWLDSNWVGVGYDTGQFTFNGTVAPSAPVIGAITATRASLTVPFAAPISDGGADIVGYDASCTSGATTVTVTDALASPVEVTGLLGAREYSCSVRATNGIATSDWSAPMSARTTGEPTAPGKPTSLAVTRPGSGSVTVSWAAPADDGGSAITGYEVLVGDATEPACSTSVGVDADPLRCAVTGLTNGETYVLSVRAVNGIGTGAAEMVEAVPGTAPGVPKALTATRSGSGSLLLEWSAPDDSGGFPVTQYRVFRDGAAVPLCVRSMTKRPPDSLSCTASGLTNGTTYGFSVVAVNAVGAGEAARVSGIPATPPSAPTSVASVSAGPGSVTVTWAAPSSSGGLAVEGYRVRQAGVTDPLCTVLTLNSAPLTCTATGLTDGTSYAFTVEAYNAAGAGATAQTSIVAGVVPGAPTGFTATRSGSGSLTLEWQAPASGGSPALTGYRVRRTGVTEPVCSTLVAVSATPRSCTVTGLVNGTTYTFTVEAYNAVGTSGTASASKAPATVPGRPTGLEVVDETTSTIQLRWSAPASNGGAAVTGYTVMYRAGTAEWVSVPVAGTSTTLTGLASATAYDIEVYALNGEGSSVDPAKATASTVGVQQEQAITVAGTVPTWASEDDSWIALAATAESGNAVTFDSDSEACFVVGDEVLPFEPGPCEITASVEGGVAWLPASTTFTIWIVPAPPGGAAGVVIAGGALWTNSTKPVAKVVWPLGANRMRVATTSGGLAAAPWVDVAISAKVTLPASGSQATPRTVYVEFSGPGLAANVVASDSIGLDTGLPSVTGVTSKALTKLSKGTRTWRVTVSVKDAASGFAQIDLGRASSSTPTAYLVPASVTSLSVALTLDYKGSPGSYRIRVIDRAGNVSAWKSLSLS